MSFLDDLAAEAKRIASGKGATPIAHAQDGSIGVPNAIGGGAPNAGSVVRMKQISINLAAGIPNQNDTGEYAVPGNCLWVDPTTTGIAYGAFEQPGFAYDDPGVSLTALPYKKNLIPLIPGTVIRMPMQKIFISAPVMQAFAGQTGTPTPPMLTLWYGDFDVLAPAVQNLIPGISVNHAIGVGFGAIAGAASYPIVTVQNYVNLMNGLGVYSGGFIVASNLAVVATLLANNNPGGPAGLFDGIILAADFVSPSGLARAIMYTSVKVPPGYSIYGYCNASVTGAAGWASFIGL